MSHLVTKNLINFGAKTCSNSKLPFIAFIAAKPSILHSAEWASGTTGTSHGNLNG